MISTKNNKACEGRERWKNKFKVKMQMFSPSLQRLRSPIYTGARKMASMAASPQYRSWWPCGAHRTRPRGKPETRPGLLMKKMMASRKSSQSLSKNLNLCVFIWQSFQRLQNCVCQTKHVCGPYAAQESQYITLSICLIRMH